MAELLFFIIGVLFSYLAVPWLNKLCDLLCIATEVLSSKCAVLVSKNNEEITQIQNRMGSNQSNANPIGFMVDSQEEYDDWDEED